MTQATQTIPKGYKQTEIGMIPVDWDVKKLNHFLDFEQPSKYLVKDTEYSDDYSIPVLTAGKTFLLGYTNETQGVFNNLPVIIFDDFTTAIKFVNFPFKAKSSAMKMLLPKNDKVNLRFIYEIMSRIKYPLGDHKRHWIGEYQFLEIPIPVNESEQIAIATTLADTDTLIENLEKLIAKKKAIKQGAMQQLLTGKKRLPGFSGEWEVKKLKDIATYRRGSFPQPYGLEKWYDNNFGMPFVQVVDVDENFKLKNETKQRISKEGARFSVFVKKGTIVLTIQGSIGRICITQYDSYVDRTLLIFESFKEQFDKYFFMLKIFQKFEIEKQKAPGGIIKTITKEALSEFEIEYPSNLQEQTTIASVLFDMDTEIETLENKLGKYCQIKTGMMQQLLTGKIRLLRK